MSIRQIFCSVSDLIADMEKPGGDEAHLLEAIEEASSELEMEFGYVIPVTQTTKVNGYDNSLIYPFPPVLALTGSITNDGVALVENTDYVFMRRCWSDGPYLGVEIRHGGQIEKFSSLYPDSIQVPCLAGLYDRAVKLGATVATEQSASAETLIVNNGGKVSPGMILKIGSEQEYVTGWGAPTESVTLLNGALTETAEEVIVDDSTKAEIGEIMRADFEQMRITDRRITGNKLYVARGWNNTSRAAHLDNAPVDVYRTVNVERAVNGTTAAVHAAAADLYRQIPPKNLLGLGKEIATLILNMAGTGYAGRSGDREQGTVFYHDKYPRYEIERIKQQYWIGTL